METKSDCLHLKVNLKEKNYLYVNTTTERGQNKIINTDFSRLPPVSTTPVVVLGLRISPRILEKNQNGPNGILRRLGKLNHEKTSSRKSRDTVLLRQDLKKIEEEVEVLADYLIHST